MRSTPVCLTFDHLGRGAEVGRGAWVRPAPDAPEITTAIPRTLTLLSEIGVTGTFYIEGWSALHHRDVVTGILQAGHECGVHGWVHERWDTLDLGEQERLLHDSIAALRTAGAEKIGFRAPHGNTTEETFSLLSEGGIHHDSSRLPTDDTDPHPRLVHGVAHVPFLWPMVDFWLLRKRQPPLAIADLCDEWFRQAEQCHEQGLPVVVDIHPFFAALDEDIWSSVKGWIARIDADPRFHWDTVGSLADGIDRGRPPARDEPLGAWATYLSTRGHEVAEAAQPEPLVGGVSASVIRVGDVVVKRPLPQLSVPNVWLADTDRALAEVTAMRRAVGIAPQVVDLDRDSHVFVMEHVAGQTWKEKLMSGVVAEETAATAGRLLAQLHTLDPTGLFAPTRVDELRFIPYLDAAAQRLPSHREALGRVADRLRRATVSGGTHLVHGDYSPKNLLVDGERVMVLDWEVAHAGDPMFDIAFMLVHLLSKSHALPEHAPELAQSAQAFLHAYSAAGASVDHAWTAQILGALVLGRTDGLSPLSYLTDAHRVSLRAIASDLINEGAPLWPL